MRNKRRVFVQVALCGVGLWGCSSTTAGSAETGVQQAGTVAPAPGQVAAPAMTSVRAGTPARAGAGGPQTGMAGVVATAPVARAGTGAPASAAAGTTAVAPVAGTPASGAAGAPTTAGAAGAAIATAGNAGAAGAVAVMAGTGAPAQVACPAQSLKPGESTVTLMIDNMPRTFILHVPASYTGKPTPFVIDFHPLGTNKEFQRGMSGYLQLSDSEGFIAAWPDGIQNVWNVGPCCTQSRDIHDVEFARAIVDDVSKKVCVDPKRVYATGYSMGGGMSHYLACKAADVFATVAPAAFDLLEENSPDCKPTRPMSVISFRGTNDLIALYNGGESSPPTTGYRLPNIHFLGAQACFKRWAEIDGCTGEPTDAGGGCKTYAQCKDGVEVTLCVKTGGGHDEGDPMRGWEFMKKHPMP